PWLFIQDAGAQLPQQPAQATQAESPAATSPVGAAVFRIAADEVGYVAYWIDAASADASNPVVPPLDAAPVLPGEEPPPALPQQQRPPLLPLETPAPEQSGGDVFWTLLAQAQQEVRDSVPLLGQPPEMPMSEATSDALFTGGWDAAGDTDPLPAAVVLGVCAGL